MNRYGSPAEQLLRNFNAWEERGRGWAVYRHAVELEPPFRPFNQHYIFEDPDAADAGRRPGLLARLLGDGRQRRERAPSLEELERLRIAAEEPDLEEARWDSPLTELHVRLPLGYEPSRALSEQLLESLYLCDHPLSFELIGTSGGVSLQFVAHDDDVGHARQALSSLMPEAVILERGATLENAWPSWGHPETIVEFGLSAEFMRPLRPFPSFGVDPIAAIVGALVEMQEEEIALLQVLFQPVRNPWAESIRRAVVGNDGAPLPVLPPDLPALALQKTRRPLFAVVVRLAAATGSERRTLQVLKHLASTLSQFTDPASNELVPLSNDDYFDEDDHHAAIFARVSHRPGMILNLEELTGLVHLPWAAVRHPKFERLSTRTKRAPALALGHDLVIGTNEHNGERLQVTLSAEQRMRHTYVIGASGSGKSVFLLNCILQDVADGRGFAVFDPHGDLIDEVLSRIPLKRAGDVLVLDPADEEFPVGMNVLSAHSELERTLLSSDLVGIFRRFTTSWGDQMSAVLGNAVMAFLESSTGGTLFELKRFLSDSKFRSRFLESVTDPETVYYWKKDFPLIKGNPQVSITTRLDTFLRPKLIRRMFAQHRGIDFRALMDERRIVLVKLSQGAIGDENAYLLGALLTAKFNQAALSRQELAQGIRADFFLYLDEFQRYVTPSIADLLSGVRKYRLGLVLAHQNLAQLGGREDPVAASLLSNAYTRIVFRVGEQDAKPLVEGLSGFEAKDLQNLGIGQAIARVERSEFDFNLATLPPPEATDRRGAEAQVGRIIEGSRQAFATPRAEVDAYLAQLYESVLEEPAERPSQKREESARPVGRPERPAETAEPGDAAAPAKRPRAPVVPPALPRAPGRGGREHKYLQGLIKNLGEKEGFRATLEKHIEGGVGIVDVVLEQQSCAIACEVAVSSGPEAELVHLQNCLAAGFTHVVSVSPDKKRLTALSTAAAEALRPSEMARVQFLTPEKVPAFLAQVAAALKGSEERVGGYTVRSSYHAVDEARREEAEKRVAQTIGEALLRMRKKDQSDK